MARGIVNGLIVGLELVGAVLFGYAVVSVGLRGRRPQSRRLWGTAVDMPRARFGAYFGAVGLSFSLLMHLILFLEPALLLVVVVVAVLFFVLLAGWLMMLLQSRRQNG